MRTDQQIVDETNTLALWLLNEVYGYEVPEGHKFYEADDPRSKTAWQKACRIQEIMTKTDPNDALSNLDTVAEEEPIIRTYGIRLWGTFRACVEDTVEAGSLDEAVKKAASLSLDNYRLNSFNLEQRDGDESVTVYGPDDNDPNDEDAWGGDGVSVELHDEGEPLSWEACQLVKDLAKLEPIAELLQQDDIKATVSIEQLGVVANLVSRAKRACTKITGGMEG